jgi:hypothetical protein
MAVAGYPVTAFGWLYSIEAQKTESYCGFIAHSGSTETGFN